MIILDTNVISELIANPDGAVAGRVAAATGQVAITSITLAELRYGVELLPQGRRKQSLEARISVWVETLGAELILPFEGSAAEAFGRIRAGRRIMGRPITFADAAIAAISTCHEATLYTGNTKDFEHTGVNLFNPWQG